jgi:anti-anti-sigma factor
MSKDKPFRVEVTVDAPRDEVWRALTEPEQIRDRFGWHYDGLEEEIDVIFVKDATLVPPERIELGADGWIEMIDAGPRSAFVSGSAAASVFRLRSAACSCPNGDRPSFGRSALPLQRLRRYDLARQRTFISSRPTGPAAVSDFRFAGHPRDRGSRMQRPPSEPVEPFRCDISREHDAARIRPVGDLDLDTAPRLIAGLDALRAEGFRRLILDLRDLSFMDSSGLRCILEYHAEGRRDGFSLALVPGSPRVQRVFELTQTLSRLSFIDP